MLTNQVPVVLRSELYAIPALVAGTMIVAATQFGIYGTLTACAAALVCFAIRMIGVHFGTERATSPQAGTLGGPLTPAWEQAQDG